MKSASNVVTPPLQEGSDKRVNLTTSCPSPMTIVARDGPRPASPHSPTMFDEPTEFCPPQQGIYSKTSTQLWLLSLPWQALTVTCWPHAQVLVIHTIWGQLLSAEPCAGNKRQATKRLAARKHTRRGLLCMDASQGRI